MPAPNPHPALHPLLILLALTTPTRAAESLRPAVVHVGRGCSGVSISPDGAVLTARHCVNRQGETLAVRFENRDPLTGRVVYIAPQSDLAVLRLTVPAKLPFVRVAETAPQVGDWVWSEGYPAGQYARMEGRVTYVGQRTFGRRMSLSWPFMIRPRAGAETMFVIETSFRIQAGNSGGALFNQAGELIGIASMVPVGEENSSSIWMHTQDLRAALQAAGIVPDAATKEKPSLLVFTSAGCEPCTAFKTDFGATGSAPRSPDLRQQLDAVFDVQLVDFAAHPDLVAKHQIERTPTFVPTGSGRRIVGYAGVAWLLQQLAPDLAQPYVRDPASSPPAAAVPAVPGVATIPPGSEPSADSAEISASDYSPVNVVLLVKQQSAGAVSSVLREALERLAEGPVRRALQDRLGQAATVEIIFERLHPARFAAVVNAAGLPDSPVMAVVLVEKQFTGIKEKLAERIESALNEVREARFKNAPLDLIFERTDPADYAAILAAVHDDSEPAGPPANSDPATDPALPAWLLWLLGLVGGGEGLWTSLQRRPRT